MTAVQANPRSHRKSASYPGLIRDALVTEGHDVTWCDPDVRWDLEYLRGYDAVLVGVSSITGLPANRCYGALNVIERLWSAGDRRLFLFVDAPEPSKIYASLRAICDHPDNFTKDFFAYRKGFNEARDPANRPRLLETVYRLLKEEWPRTFVPLLPWHGQDLLANQLPDGAQRSIVPVNLDMRLHVPQQFPEAYYFRWSMERGHDTWIRNLRVSWPVLPTFPAAKAGGDHAVLRELSESAGLIIPPYREGTWWSPRIVQATTLGKPVVSEWRQTSPLGEPWATLASTVEDMSPAGAERLATAQLESYLHAVQLDEARLFETLSIRRRK